MKKRLFTITLLLWGGLLQAQIEKGNGILSGTVSIDYSQNELNGAASRAWEPTIALTAGQFFADNWLLGLSVAASTSFGRQEVNLGFGQQVTNRRDAVSVTTTPFIRRYWKFSSAYIFAGVGLAVGVGGIQQITNTLSGSRPVQTDQRTGNVSLRPSLEAGLNYLFTNRLALQLSAATSSMPFNVASLNAGLVYWTGPGRRASSQKERANPQTDKGRWLLEGSFAVENQSSRQVTNSNNSETNGKATTYSVSPSISYFISKNNLVGISIPFNFIAASSAGSRETNSAFSVGFSPYYQHYWTSTRLTPFTRVNATYTILKYNGDDNTLTGYGAGVDVGLAYMAGQRFIVETSLGNLSVNRFGGSGTNEGWGVNLSGGLTGNFAVRYVFK